MKFLLANWKTTVQSVLTSVIGLSGIAAIPQISILPPKIAGYLALAGAVSKIVLGVFQQDAGSTLAKVPGQASPQVVPSHEVPDSPTATPVTPNNGK